MVTGSDGYIGAVMAPYLARAGHEVVGLDSLLFADCTFGPEPERVPTIAKDIRDVGPGDLAGFDAVVHLAAISNDPLGNLNPGCTYDINHLARPSWPGCQAAGDRYLVLLLVQPVRASDNDGFLDEQAPFNRSPLRVVQGPGRAGQSPTG